jgi:ornithine decarboxylase
LATQAALTKDLLQALFQRCPVTPALLVDLGAVEADFLEFRSAFGRAPIFYAIKANPHPAILRRLVALGSGFEVSSAGELRHLAGLGVPGGRVISGNPVKAPDFIREAAALGVRDFAFDSTSEVDKAAALAPRSRLFVRLNVPNDASAWPLDKKYGVEIDEALELLAYARARGVATRGVIFHVGSQCRDVAGWRVALEKSRRLWDEARRHGFDLGVVNVGGGMPVVYTDPAVPGPRAVAAAIFQACADFFPPHVEVWLEPGRAIVGRAGTLVASVIGVSVRGGHRWVYLDTGVFHGLMEALGGIRYRFLSDAPGPEAPCTIAGPSCDSMDVITTDGRLPQVRVGDRVAIASCGAYTTVYSSIFNGFPGPETIVFDSGADA